MSDDALNAHLDWLDDCAKEQGSECEHLWYYNTDDYWYDCEKPDCDASLGVYVAEDMLNEHAELKRANRWLRRIIEVNAPDVDIEHNFEKLALLTAEEPE